MISDRLKRALKGSKFYSLEVFDIGEETLYSLCEFELRKGELDVLDEIVHPNIEFLKGKIEKNRALFLVINTSQIIKKLVQEPLDDNPELALINAFPSLDLDQFYYEFCTLKNSYIVNIAKQEYVEWMVEQLGQLGLRVASISLGVSSAGQLLPFMRDRSLDLTNLSLNLSPKGIETIQVLTQMGAKSFAIDDIKVSSTAFMGMCKCLDYLKGLETNRNTQQLNKRLLSEVFNQNFFARGVQISLVSFLLLLTINFVVFQRLEKKNNHLLAEMQISKTKSEALSNAKQRVEEKREKLKSISRHSSSGATYYLDRIAMDIPDEIWLKELTYQPLNQPVNSTKRIDLQKGEILISGISNDQARFTKWTERLERNSWVKEVLIQDYNFLTKRSSEFTLKIGLHEKL